jgi:hypothetical protein
MAAGSNESGLGAAHVRRLTGTALDLSGRRGNLRKSPQTYPRLEKLPYNARVSLAEGALS